MFVKLNFTTSKNFVHVRQILNAIINDTSIDSAAALTTAASSWNANIVSGIDYSTTEIIRTVEPTTVRSHLADNDTSYNFAVWTLEFQVYDAPTKKYYISFDSTSGTTSVNASSKTRIVVGDTIGAGDMGANQALMSVDLNVGSRTSGTPVTLSSTEPAQFWRGAGGGDTRHQYDSSPINNSGNIRTFWMYLTNDCLIVAHTGSESSNLGFNATYTDATRYTGPYIFSQYTRYDYHNTDANGVIPLMFTNTYRTLNVSTASPGLGFGVGVGNQPDWQRSENVNHNQGDATAFRVFNLIDAHPRIGTSWPLMSFPQVNWGSGSRTTEEYALTSGTTGSTSLSSSQSTYGRLIHADANTRYPSNDLRTVGYGMLPLRWSNTYRGNQGGNATDRGGFYIFNGDYFPGDTFIHNDKTYIIWPTFRGYANRVGIAVPKE